MSFEYDISSVTTGICGQNMNSFAMQTIITLFNSLPIPCSFEEETLLTHVKDLQAYLFSQHMIYMHQPQLRPTAQLLIASFLQAKSP